MRLSVLLTAAVLAQSAFIFPLAAAEPSQVMRTYADIAQAKYEDSLATAKTLKGKVAELVAKPSDATLKAAREAWKTARAAYQQTEVYRFGNAWVDDWEGKVNSWPLDEGLIDYVDASYGTTSDQNPLYTANVIANKSIQIGGDTVDATKIDIDLLQKLQSADDVEANVATGYHAIEFMLWGQDLNGTGPGAGNRPASDYARGAACTHGNCDRRAAYLGAATELLVKDLNDAVDAWGAKGEARQAALEDSTKGLANIFKGMGSLSYGELAGERMKLGLLLHDPEQEQDCFSDNTHNSHYYDAVGIRDAYLGQYKRVNGKEMKGASPSDLVKAKDPALDAEMRKLLDASVAKIGEIKKVADSGEMAYDQMIGENNPKGNALVQAGIDALLAQTKGIEKVVAALNLSHIDFQGSDSLDKPDQVAK
jgi:putative iron-regulated protein